MAQQPRIKELTVISGKGGTGKTSLTASFAALADHAVLTDCDVDAANLHLIIKHHTVHREPFISGFAATIDQKRCIGCGLCMSPCTFEAIVKKDEQYIIDQVRCEGCGLCVDICPADAIDFLPAECGMWMVSETDYGPMVHAHLHAAAENSGKLVTLVRKKARSLAEEQHRPLIITDGPPGIGCPVIASLTGTDAVLIVAEPSASAFHDIERVGRLAQSFEIPVFGCINKYDIDVHLSEKIEEFMVSHGYVFSGTVGYDTSIVDAQTKQTHPLEIVSKETRKRIQHIWETVWEHM